jgi:NAD(P)-dependent dehydrogenase (short-subunit alcohol dehydrogenase family)
MPESFDWLGDNAFAGKRVLVTGGANGIGAALADLVVSHGGKCAVLDREIDPSTDTDVRRSFKADVSNTSDVDSAVAGAAEWMGGLDMVANVAGISRDGSLTDTEWDSLFQVLDINLLGALRVCRAAFPHLLESDCAAVVNIGSLASVQVYGGGGLYGASKAGLTQMSYQMAIEWARLGIRVNVVNPGPIETRLATHPTDPAQAAARYAKYPLGRRGTPVECANAIAFLMLPASAYMTAQQVMVSGGLEQTALAGRDFWENQKAKLAQKAG